MNTYTVRILSVGDLDMDNDNVDVEVRFEDGRRYIPTFFTIANIRA